jgi:glycosyltransferase involved in cell wall biosynthesis
MVRKACTAWHFTSEQEAQNSWPWDSSPGFVVPNGVEPDEFAVDRDEARQEVWRSHPELKDSPYVLFLGRLHTKKRLDVLIPAFLQGTPQPFKLVIAGPDESKLWENLAARFLGNPRAAERVLYVGTVAGAHKMRLLAGANLFALPSQHENFGIAPLEALAAGTPVLLSPHVDLANLLEGSGLSYTEPIDTKRWAARIADLLARSQPLPQDVESLRAWARESFSWSQVANRLIERYRSVMAGCTNRSCLTNYETDSNRVEKG